MSHVVQIQTEVRDLEAVRRACSRLGHQFLPYHHHRFYDGTTRIGPMVQLQGWEHPVALDEESGSLFFDDFGGRWGSREVLDQFIQMYSVCKIDLEAQKNGLSCREKVLADGSIELEVGSF